MNWWHTIKDYYSTIGDKYKVDPLIFAGIHLIATPLFAVAVAWILYNKKKKISILMPAIIAAFIFNAASIYLILSRQGIPYIYLFVGIFAVISGYFTYHKIKKRIADVK